MARWFIYLVTIAATAAAVVPSHSLPVKLETRAAIKSRVANVHLEFKREINGGISFTYGHCSSVELHDTHHTILESEAVGAHRLVWVVPEDAESGGCLQAWGEDGLLLGRSEPQTLSHHWKRRMKRNKVASIEMNNETGIDTIGAWFEGVRLLENKQPSPVHVEKAKDKEVAIVGAGIAGLMNWLVLDQAGMKNIKIIEGSKRLGGRIRTEYLSGGPFDYSYQEMGPMRLPYQYTDPKTNKTYNINDQYFVFQLADELNRLNSNKSDTRVDFIPWIQDSPNGLTYFNGFKIPGVGLPPTVGQIAANGTLGPPQVELSESAQKLQAEAVSYLPGDDFTQLMAENIFQAHADWIREGMKGLGGDVWSEFAFMVNYLGGSLNDTNSLGNVPNDHNQWYLLYNMFYFVYGTWRTIDGGMSRLPQAFKPLVDNITTYEARVERISFDSDKEKLTLQWRKDFTSRDWIEKTFDYAIISAPFPVVRSWRLPPLGVIISSAISDVPYLQACKMALEFSERFWEQYENPIYGSCSTTTDIPGIGSICYPSYNLNGTGPASILASYDVTDYWISQSDEAYAQYVFDVMVEIHGDKIRALYTGKYERKCWMEDPFANGVTANPTVGMHSLYIPEYFKTHQNMIFVGEHTSVTQSWLAPAIESGLRGAVQLLLELGLVDEAKEAVDKWAGRWIDI